MAPNKIEINERFKQSLEHLFNPFIRVVPEKDWSSIKAIWIPFLHHDYKNQLEKSDQITILQPTIDKFGTVQGYLTSSNENYIPYLTTFFNSTWTADQVVEHILQAEKNIVETQSVVTDTTGEQIIRKTIIGRIKSGMLISITKNCDDKIIDAFPIFDLQHKFNDETQEKQSDQTSETLKINQPSIIVTKSSVTNDYVTAQPMTYDFYLLYLLFTQSLPAIEDADHFKKNIGIDFCKNSSTQSLVTSQLFIHKNNGYIELFSIYDLINTDDLCLPKSPKFIMTAKNFMNFMVQKNQIHQQQPHQLFIAIDNDGHAHATTNLQSLTKISFFAFLQKKLSQNFFTK